jgi:hypothetical protein
MKWTVLLAVASVVAALIGASHANAGDGIAVSGSYTATDFGTTNCAFVGGSGFMFRCDTTGFVSDYTGDLEGTAVADFTQLIDCKTGRAYGHGSETFTGSVEGVGSGTLTYTDQFSSDFDCTVFFPFNLDINSVAVAGSGGLAGLQGTLHFDDTTYSGTLR